MAPPDLTVAVHGRGLFVADATAGANLAGMTFSITAGGTQQDALTSLARLSLADELGRATADLLIQAITSGPSEVVDGKYPHYSASAYGHSPQPGGGLPSLSVSLGVTYVPVPEERGGIESAPDPADVR